MTSHQYWRFSMTVALFAVGFCHLFGRIQNAAIAIHRYLGRLLIGRCRSAPAVRSLRVDLRAADLRQTLANSLTTAPLKLRLSIIGSTDSIRTVATFSISPQFGGLFGRLRRDNTMRPRPAIVRARGDLSCGAYDGNCTKPLPTHHHRKETRWIVRIVLTIITLAVTALMTAPSTSASGAPTVTTVVRHVAFAEHYPPYCGIPGTTEYLTGTDRYHLVLFPDGSVNVAWGGSFKIHQVYDDPALTPIDRQGFDAGVFHLTNNGPVIFHESFRDRNSDFGDIFIVTTFVELNGQVIVDHSLARNLPGC